MTGFAARLIGSAFHRFPDPSLERRYRFEQRSRQAWFTVRMTYLGAAVILAVWIIAFATLDRATALGLVLDQSWFVPILVVFGWLVSRPGYADAWWVDVGLFTVIQFPLYRSVSRMHMTQITGWPFNTQFCYTLMLAWHLRA